MSPATTAARGPAGNLPAEVTSFVGRRHEVGGVRRLLSTARLVTLTGPGGVGKTRLAYRVSAELRRAYTDGVWLAELAELTDPALLEVTVAEALGLPEESARAGSGALTRFFADRQALLVLDNCEQLVPAVGRLAESLLRSCPDLRILTTTRQPLQIAGEALLTVQPLPVPEPDAVVTPQTITRYESAGLFVDRAAAVLPGFTVTEANTPALAELCRALEGMPLAIELAASRLRVLSLEQILARLTDRYHLLTTGPRSAPPRQQTLRALIDWSWDLCSDAERTLWSRLSVFSGGLELDAAEDVCSGGELTRETILDLVASLVDKSVLIRTEDGPHVRFRLLEVIRDYGADRLRAAGEQAALRRRHCQFYAHLAARGDARWVYDQAEVLRRFQQEQANLRVALEFAVTEGPPETAQRFAADLESHWYVRGHLTEGRHWLERALAMGSTDHWTRVKALRVSAWINTMLGEPARGEALLDEAQALAETLPPSVGNSYIPLIRGNIRLFAGEHPAALALFGEAIEGFQEAGARSGEMWSLVVLGLSRGLAGDPADGYPELRAAIASAEAAGEIWWRSFAQWALSVLQWRAGDLRAATASARQSLAVREQVEDEQFSVGMTLEAMAWIATAEGRDRRAAQLLGASERMWRAMRTSLAVFRSIQEYHRQSVEQLRSRMGPAAFEAAVRRGTQLTPDEAIDLALERTAEPASGAPAQRSPADPLTRREREVAELLAQGLSNKDIAARLVVAQRTAEGHVENILSKLGLTSRAQVAAWMADNT
ncbi:ATP-binding protein [Spirilliplanes yamanashiensis]|uniref:LuxR family transcriptional regulator n=1 Tax=Spirilliplanes yamanashiensis TaxID=42233 RepID=A0A8J3Y5X5_9ACTN|nr:LuxR C-terminal-related transcriptional regulator [Spirilliplanes yamanashiensis]MDP9819219.1 non-specific serine/threonine protein kinase [Spirilliplanes yamanashiensis]GIJ01958.1 LuxR family transcriptional regulator [Spirilliplanes yamanashiensis]